MKPFHLGTLCKGLETVWRSLGADNTGWFNTYDLTTQVFLGILLLQQLLNLLGRHFSRIFGNQITSATRVLVRSDTDVHSECVGRCSGFCCSWKSLRLLPQCGRAPKNCRRTYTLFFFMCKVQADAAERHWMNPVLPHWGLTWSA